MASRATSRSDQRKRKAHSKSRSGCIECKRRHHKCDECYPQCGSCRRQGTSCSLTSPNPNSELTFVERPLAVDDLRLLHHWHTASRHSDFAKFVDHDHVDGDAEYDRIIDISFSHPYLLHIILALSALHILHADPQNMGIYEQASAHNLAALRLARPQVMRASPEHIEAMFVFTGFASLYATAEPPLRLGDANIEDPIECVKALLDAFHMSRGIGPVVGPHENELEERGILDKGRWRVDCGGEMLSTLEMDYPQMSTLRCLISKHSDGTQQGPLLNAVHLLFAYVAVLATKPQNHSSISLIQLWPIEVDAVVLQMLSALHPVALVILAHYALLMHMRRNYWFFNRWPRLLLQSTQSLLPLEWHEYIKWPQEVIGGCTEH